MARHASGESLASIARAYRCTPPAIRYIVRHGEKTKAQGENDQADAASASLGLGEHEMGSGRPPTSVLSLPPRSRALDSVTQPEVESGKIGFNSSLRDAMTLEVSTFLVMFDAVMAQPSAVALDQLRTATDRLLRAAARIRIELERMLVAGAHRTNNPGRPRKRPQ